MAIEIYLDTTKLPKLPKTKQPTFQVLKCKEIIN